MSYAKADILTEVRAILNEPSAVFWSDTELNEWIDMAAQDLSSKTLCYQTSSTITLATDTVSYTEPTGCLKVKGALYSNRGLLRMTPMQFGNNSPTTGAPIGYMHFASKIWIFPTPTLTENTDTVMMLYSAETDDITDIPDQYQIYAIDFVVAKALEKDRKLQQAAFFYSKYLQSLAFHRADLYELGTNARDEAKLPDRAIMAQ